MEYKYKLGFIGAGNMAKAIVNGIVNSSILSKNEIIMSNTHSNGTYNDIKMVTDNNEVLQNSEFIILAIKPQIFKSISNTFKNSNAKCVISIMAGINIDKIQSIFTNAKIVRVMPNTPSSIGYGMSCITNNISDSKIVDFVSKVFNSIGKICYLKEEQFDAVTSISGSGPAYAYYFINSMINAGIEGGLSKEDSTLLTLQTIIGSCKMVENSNEEILVLLDKVCSKGGTTIQAINSFREDDLEGKIKDGIKKCRLRSKELSKE